ncbi:DDE-type integrase/transposase/recombinase [Patescibacteria group bacterium]|nr:DDE-type integrase/transposase/recombinase [Patescibacteria group bacterium]MBU1683567.1 DDE-type integrase/transposase/recombinase [Patescibacteria group bacterium]MBU1934616.1 DDE-type integrase/transposase/recombinase [Patescibacteria group bacterium]
MNNKYLNERQLIQYRKRVLRDCESYTVAKAARIYGLHRSTIYEWKKSVKPKKTGPKGRVFWQTNEKLEKEIVRIRKVTNYGPKRIKQELETIGVKVGEKAIRGILNRERLVKNHKKKRVRKKQKFYAPYPGYRIQIDTKAVPDPETDLRSAERYQFTSIDIASRIRFCWIYDELSNANSIDFLNKVLRFYEEIGIGVECVQTDNHMTFTNLYVGGRKKKEHQYLRLHPFTKRCLKNGIAHILSRPGTPRHNCFVERSHRTDEEEFYRLLDLPSLNNQKLQLELQKWMFRYNFLRLHSSCNNMPPIKNYQTVWTTGA